MSSHAPARKLRNDPAQYEELADQWWNLRGPFAMLHWIAKSRASLVPPASRPGAVLIDLGCGAGLTAPHVTDKGYAHVGCDLSFAALELARSHGVVAVRADVTAVPFSDGVADVVCAGEILEHVPGFVRVVKEACRLLRPGGLLVLDTIANTMLARIIAVEIGERIPGAAPPGIHDYRLFVDRRELVAACANAGVRLQLNGLRPSWCSLASWAAHRSSTAEMVPTWSTAVLFQGIGQKTS